MLMLSSLGGPREGVHGAPYYTLCLQWSDDIEYFPLTVCDVLFGL